MNFAPLRLSIVVPTYNELQHVRDLLNRIDAILGSTGWEVVFVDDDSPDGTASFVRRIAQADFRVRCLQRIHRQGRSSASIEGMLATSAPVIAVMDAVLQHDETALPRMLAEIEGNNADVVIATRYAQPDQSADGVSTRAVKNRIARAARRALLGQDVSDPMSGFFMLRRQVLDTTVHGLSGLGFTLLLDILATSKHRAVSIAEVPDYVRDRPAGTRSHNAAFLWEYCMLLADKTIGHLVPVRFVAFALIGGLGVFVHMAVLALLLKGLDAGFPTAQAAATGTAMIFNFGLNNLLTYRDRQLTGWKWFTGLLSFMVACSVGAFANVGIATYLFEHRTQWVLAALAGILVGVGWNYAVTQFYTWGKSR